MKHPTDDMLLAYVRQQQRSLWPADIQEHIASCSQCSERCAEFKMVGDTIEMWTRTSAVDPLYATVSNRVMRTLYAPKAAPMERGQRGVSRVHVVLPIAVVFMLLCTVLLVGLGVNIVGNVAKSKQAQPTSGVVLRQPTAIKPTPTLGPIPTVATSPTATMPVVPNGSPVATSTSQGDPSIEVSKPCTTEIDIAQNQLHVCGANFTPGATVMIYYQIGTKNKKHTMQVAADGTFIDVLYIQDCKDVPNFIYVQSLTSPIETAQITKDIPFGTCQGFGNFRNP